MCHKLVGIQTVCFVTWMQLIGNKVRVCKVLPEHVVLPILLLPIRHLWMKKGREKKKSDYVSSQGFPLLIIAKERTSRP